MGLAVYTFSKKFQCFRTRMWANAQRDGRRAETGGALFSTPQSLADAHYWRSAVQ